MESTLKGHAAILADALSTLRRSKPFTECW
jgi:hypothetical protein